MTDVRKMAASARSNEGLNFLDTRLVGLPAREVFRVRYPCPCSSYRGRGSPDQIRLHITCSPSLPLPVPDLELSLHAGDPVPYFCFACLILFLLLPGASSKIFTSRCQTAGARSFLSTMRTTHRRQRTLNCPPSSGVCLSVQHYIPFFTAAKQTFKAWRRARRVTVYMMLVWLEWASSTTMGAICWCFLKGSIKPGLEYFMAICQLT